MIAATGPFTTSDNLDMGALRDLMEVVKQEKPDVLVLVRIVLNEDAEALSLSYIQIARTFC